MSKKHLILISGKQGSGKTTLSNNLLSSLLFGNPTVQKFAGILYEMHDAIKEISLKYGIPFEGTKKELLQYLGTDFFRNNFGAGVWVESLKIKLSKSSSQIIVIDDCRFQNELSAFDNSDVFTVFKIRINCDKELRKQRCSCWRENDRHISEIDLDESKFDLYLDTGVMSQEESTRIAYVNIVNHICRYTDSRIVEDL